MLVIYLCAKIAAEVFERVQQPSVVGKLLACADLAVLGYPLIVAIFVGAAMVATSVGITARVLRDLGVIATTESRIILAERWRLSDVAWRPAAK